MATPDNISGISVKRLLRIAESSVEKSSATSKLFDAEAEARIPKFDLDELELGKVLGRGGFCVVSEIRGVKLKQRQPESSEHLSDLSENRIQNLVQTRGFIAANCLRRGKDCRYAIKRLQESTYKDAELFANGVVDLAIEARFLAVIQHPNIVKMRALCSGTAFHAQYFIVLDRLYDILSHRLTKWKRKQPTGLGTIFMKRQNLQKEKLFWVERLTVAYDLAGALAYLHELGVMYRDIKPENIGFDIRGDVKIFDFGLAKEFDQKQSDKHGNYKFTGDTGSVRYMATEIALGKPYNEKCDVYSLSILIWQMLALETPFECYTMNMFQRSVVNGGVRPKCDTRWPKEIQDALRAGWGDARDRPSMNGVCSILQEEINRNSKEDVYSRKFRIVDASRRSARALLGLDMKESSSRRSSPVAKEA